MGEKRHEAVPMPPGEYDPRVMFQRMHALITSPKCARFVINADTQAPVVVVYAKTTWGVELFDTKPTKEWQHALAWVLDEWDDIKEPETN